VIAVDTNILVHGHQREASLHERAREAIRGLAESPVPWGVCYHSLVEFYGVVTQPRLWHEPSTPVQAMDQVAAWRESPSLRIICDTPEDLARLAGLAIGAEVRGGLIHDARIAACCLAHGITELWTVDRDYSRFGELRIRNPLA